MAPNNIDISNIQIEQEKEVQAPATLEEKETKIVNNEKK